MQYFESAGTFGHSCWDDAAQEIVYKHYVNLGIAAATPRGLDQALPRQVVHHLHQVPLRQAVLFSQLADRHQALPMPRAVHQHAHGVVGVACVACGGTSDGAASGPDPAPVAALTTPAVAVRIPGIVRQNPPVTPPSAIRPPFRVR